MDQSPPGSSVLSILQARILVQVAVPFSIVFSLTKGITSGFPALQADSLLFELQRKPKTSACIAGGMGLIPVWGRPPGEGKGYPLRILTYRIDGQRSLMGYSPWGCKELDTTE